MTDVDHVLLDDGTFIQIVGDEVGGGTDQLDPAIEGLTIGAGADEGPWQPAADRPGWQQAPSMLGAWEHWGVPALSRYNGMVWYRTQVTLTAAQAGKHAWLELGPVDETDMTWVNGVAVGSQYGAGERRTYALPPGLLKAGASTVPRRWVAASSGKGKTAVTSGLCTI